MPNVRLNDLARELGVKQRHIADFLHDHGINKHTPTNWINSSLAGELRAYFRGPLQKSERELAIERCFIRPGSSVDADPVPGATSRTSTGRGKQKKLAKYARCGECRKYVLRTEIARHRADHEAVRRRARTGSRAQERRNRTFRIPNGMPPVKIVSTTGIYAVENPAPNGALKLPAEKLCRECHRLVHPATMDQHMREYHAHPKLPDLKTAQFSFIILPPGYNWNYRVVLDHYLRLSHTRSFEHNAIDWTRIERIEKHLKPKLRSFGVRAWFGYAVYEFDYTDRVVVECPIEGNATYILWGDWQSRVQLTKGELRSRYPGQFRRVIHQGNWIEDVRRGLRRNS